MIIQNDNLWIENTDCITFLKKIPDNSVDLILTDPPFGINESKFDRMHYNRNSSNVISGYQEAPKNISYEEWAFSWINEFDRVLKKNGSILIVSGWTNEADIQYAVRKTNKFEMINHLIWQFNFGIYTSKKFVSSHYHILYYKKKNGKPYFNKNAYHNEDHKNSNGGSLVYEDIQDVIKINKEYKPYKTKNSNTLPTKLVQKLIKHTTKIGDVVLDIFSGGFTTQFSALKLKRKAWGCEINKKICEEYFDDLLKFDDYFESKVDLMGYDKSKKLKNQGKPLSNKEKNEIRTSFNQLEGTKKEKIEKLSNKYKRGIWSIIRIISK